LSSAAEVGLRDQRRQSGIPMITAAGHDWVPGNLAASLALSEAGDRATEVEIGYFILGKGETNGLSGGTMASTIVAALEPGFAWRGGAW